MKVMIFEWLSGGGCWIDEVTPNPGDAIQVQGAQMLHAIVEDFLAGNVEVVLPIDGRLANTIRHHSDLTTETIWTGEDLPTQLGSLADDVDHVMLIAPESGGRLLGCLKWLEPWRHKLISPGAEFVELTSCKESTFAHLESQGFEAYPTGVNFADFGTEGGRAISLPAVLKPIDGAGSEQVQFVEDWSSWQPAITGTLNRYRLEEFIAGSPVSVSVLCDWETFRILKPTRQLFDREPFGEYIGAGFPISPDLTHRAVGLAQKVIPALPPTRGYIGIDLVVSDHGAEHDCLIEINPRLTMSYLKLREIHSENLAIKMLL